MPASTPVISPALPATAVPPDPEVHVPPASASVSDVTAPSQTLAVPDMAAGSGLTVSVKVLKHPSGNVQLISVVPADIPEMIPVTEPIVAMAVLLLLHIPLDGESDNIVVVDGQRLAAPRIAPGCTFTVTTMAVAHPVGSV